MTQFSPANIPNTVTTVEELAAWAASILAELNSGEFIQVQPGQQEPLCTVQTYNFTTQLDGPERLVCVLYLPLTAGWRSEGKLVGSGVAELTTDAIPPYYTTA